MLTKSLMQENTGLKIKVAKGQLTKHTQAESIKRLKLEDKYSECTEAYFIEDSVFEETEKISTYF